MNNWLEGLGVDEQFLADVADQIPNAPESSKRFAFMVDNATFRKASETYMAKVESASGPIFQLHFEGRNIDRGFDSEPLKYSPVQANIGNGWSLSEEGDIGTQVVHAEHLKFAGSTQYGKLIRSLTEKFGVDHESHDLFLQETPSGQHVLLGPDFRRYMRWYIARNQKAPDWRNSESWNGVCIQFDGQMQLDRNGKEMEVRVPIGIAALDGETEEEFAWYENYLESLGLPLPWYALKPGEEVAERNERTGGGPAKEGEAEKAAPKAAPKTTAPAKTTTPPKTTPTTTKTTTPPKTTSAPPKEEASEAAPTGGDDDEMLGQMYELAGSAADYASFRKAAMAKAAGQARWVTWLAKPDNYKALKEGTATPPPAKK